MNRKLTQKQEQSCHDFIETGNKTEAYRRNYSTKGMTENTLNVEAVKHFNIPKVSQRVKELQEELQRKSMVTAEFVINGFKEIALSGEVEANRLKAFDLLGKHLGIYEKDNTQKPGTTANIIIDKEVVEGVLKSFDDKY
jgi:phage terminase small subunit